MSQRSIRSFFQAKPDTQATKPDKPKEKSEDDVGSSRKENVTPNTSNTQLTAGQQQTVQSVHTNKQSSEVNENLPDTNLELPIPYRKTAVKPGKRVADDASNLQANSPKKPKLEKQKIKTESPKQKNNEKVLNDKIIEDKVKSEIEEDSQSPVKISKSSKNRIVSDSEDESPVKKSPQKVDTETKPTFSIFQKKSPKKSEATPDKEEQKTPKSTPVSKKSPKKSPSEIKKSPHKSPAKDESKSPRKSPSKSPLKEETPKPSTALGTPKLSSKEKPKNPFQSFFSPKGGAAKSSNESVGKDYDVKVKKLQYHPVEDAFWKKDESTPYLALAKTLVAIEETSGRLRTIEILSNFFRSVIVLNSVDLLPAVYMILNRLAPAWEGLELGVGESFLIKAIGNTTGRNPKQIKEDMVKIGDLGLVAESSKSSQKTMFQPKPLTLAGVFGRLKEVASMTGTSITNKKVDKIQQMMVACQGPEARYLIRSLAGKLRIGLAEQSVLQALAQAVVQTPLGQQYPPTNHTMFKSAESEPFKEKLAAEAFKLKSCYAECPSYDLMLPALLEVHIAGLASKCHLTPSIPLRPMLAHPTKGIQEVLTRFENCKFTCEWKYDGERAQIHLNKDGTINIYSRNQEDNTTKYPDIISRFSGCLQEGVTSAIIDSEAVAWDRETKTIKPFQVLSTRKRKDAVETEIKVQVCVFAFDLLYLNGESLVKKNFLERRQLLRDNFKQVEGEFFYAKSVDGTTTEEIQEALDESIKDNCEGLMVKTLDHEATYEIARRSHNWLKLKKDYLDGVGDTLDLVVIGGYLGKGKRTGGYGGFLLACYDSDNEEYQSICKIGTGFSDDNLQKHATFFKQHVISEAKSYYSYDSSHAPDHWFEPVQVWEVKCADLSVSPVHKAALGLVDPSKGVSLRFPRFIRIREDKNAEAATNSDQIAEMYRNQDQIKNQIKKGFQKSDDFDF